MEKVDVIIKLRTTDGKLYKVSDVAFIEVCDYEGNLSGLVHLDPLSGSVKLYTATDQQFDNYCRMFKRSGTTARTI